MMSPASDETGAEPAARPDASAFDEHAGVAHVATASFLTARVVPTGGFWVALAGGAALARAAQRSGLRTGYGASLAATLQAVAVMGPARLGVPLTQALSAPLVGRLRAFWAQMLACIGIRACHQLVAASFYIFIIAGGVEAFTATFDTLTGWIPMAPSGELAILSLTAAGILAWTLFASFVQVLVYRAALRGWPSVVAAEPDERAVAGERGRAAERADVEQRSPDFGRLHDRCDLRGIEQRH